MTEKKEEKIYDYWRNHTDEQTKKKFHITDWELWKIIFKE